MISSDQPESWDGLWPSMRQNSRRIVANLLKLLPNGPWLKQRLTNLSIICHYGTTRANKDANFAPGIEEGFSRIYVGNLSWDITENGLRKVFSDCKNHHGGVRRGGQH
ncbi:hypothetical protein OIU77_012632 [Salix suchowensis]|uniref:RRM domain-containing protein n=1 Tax=Salix suchowensis TaxID=1278906 RepID=A0ABQ9A5L5_9ROSI|nr:hypothetical protein OIU77_012632 [Salix suchowensis]